jgi:hypothetical protein
MNRAIKNLVEIELRLVNLRVFGLESVVLLKTLIGGVLVKKKLFRYKKDIFVLYRSLLVEHVKGVRGRPPVMLFVGVAVLLFSIFSFYSYMKQSGGVLPKPKQTKQTSAQTAQTFSRDVIFPSSSFPSYSLPGSSSYKEKESAYLPSSGSSPAPASSGGYGHIVVEYVPSSKSNRDNSFSLPEGPTIKEVP